MFDMEAKTAMSLLCIEMVTNGLKKSRPKRSKKTSKGSRMSTATHYENANFLRELAESLPRIWPNGTPARTELLQRLADEELAQAQHSEWIRAKVAAARADTRPTLTTDEVRASLKARYERLRDASR